MTDFQPNGEKMRRQPLPLSAWRPLNIDQFLLGAAHYPEHVDESYWQRDAERMAECGFNVVRLGEFAWHIFEPREGEFDFSLFDNAINVLARSGIKTIMSTPTATPPRWLTKNYPEVLRVDGRGRPARHGSRQHADTTSPIYRAHSRRITKAMAEHYRDNPHVIGWQTDNELNTTVSETFSPAATTEFRQFLKGWYGDISALNHAWGTDFWAQRYDNFDQIELPYHLAPSFANPSQVLDYHRFLAASTAAFQHDQVEILRATNQDWFIFHNLGQLRDIDFRGQFSTDLDFLAYDVYPFLRDEMLRTGSHAQAQALMADIFRGFTGNFIVPEQQSGLGSQPGFATPVPEDGEMRRMAMSSIARGADGILFFRWRPAHFGAEIYWNGILDHDDVPRRRFHEAKRFGQDINRIKSFVLGTSVRMDVGIAGSDFDNQEAHKSYPLGLPSPQNAGAVLHDYCFRQGIACGFVHPEDDLSRLKLLFIPHWVIWKEEWSPKVEEFVRNGGTLVVGAHSGTRDVNNHVIRETPPGPTLSRLCGVTVEEFGLLTPPGGLGLADTIERPEGMLTLPQRPAESSRRRYLVQIGNVTLQAAYCYEVLNVAPDTEVIGKWASRFIEGSAAITTRQVERGRAIYLGTYLTQELVITLFDQVLAEAMIEPLLPTMPEGIEVTLRESVDRRLLFVINTTADPVRLDNVPSGVDLLEEREIQGGTLALDPYGCAVIQLA
jgi:beta-galactosidase